MSSATYFSRHFFQIFAELVFQFNNRGAVLRYSKRVLKSGGKK